MIEVIYNSSFITSSCFSFLIIVFTLTMYRSNNKLKLFSAAFLIILAANAVNYIFLNDAFQIDMGFLSTSMFSLYMIIVIFYGQKNKNYEFLYYMAYVFTVATIVIALKYNFLFTFIKSDLIKWLVQIAALALVLFFIKTEGSKDIQYKRAIALFLFSKVFYSIEYLNQYLSVIGFCLEAFGYVTCFSYFYNIVYSSFMDKVNEAERLKNTVERSLNYEVKKRTIEIEKTNEKLMELYKTDSLTKAYNKLAIMNIIEKLTTAKARQPFSILMFDIDNFKTINDTLGHVTGDMCIRTLASIAQANIRSIDYLGRYGGDEFIIVLPTLSTNDSRIVAERFRSRVAETNNPRFTVSIGIATFPEDGKTVKELISAADIGLYRAKERGRNAVSHSMLF